MIFAVFSPFFLIIFERFICLIKILFSMAKMSRKAQIGATALILILAVFLIAYIYAMPKEEKCKLLPDLKECKYSDEEIQNMLVPVTIFSYSPGFLEAQEKSSIYAVKPVELFNTEEIEVATLLEKQTAVKTWFDNIEKKAIFPAHEKGKEIKIFIFISKSKGKLYMNINPRLNYVFEGAGMHEASIPVSLLNKTNIIRFSVSTPLIPSETNYYDIEKVLVKETYSATDLYAKRNFTINEDMSQLEYASLSFNADCLTKELLGINVNGIQASKAVSCGENEADITEALKDKNELVFSSNGNYYVHNIRVNLYFKQQSYPAYYFVFDDEMKDIYQGKRLAMLKFEFDSNENKKFEINVNGNPIPIETSETEYQTRINDYILEGINKVKIIPQTKIMLKKIELIWE